MNRSECVKAVFSTHEVVVLTGFTKYMLDYLAREDIFQPSNRVEARRGVRRCYSFDDVVLLRALFAICNGKGKIRHLKEALKRFRVEFGRIKVGQRISKQLFVHGNELCVRSNIQVAEHLNTGQMLFSFVVDLSSIENQVSDCIEMNDKAMRPTLRRAFARKAEAERQKNWLPVKLRRCS